MKRTVGILFFFALVSGACGLMEPAPYYMGVPAYLDTPGMPATQPVEDRSTGISQPPFQAKWQIQYSGEMNYNMDVNVYNLDLFEANPADMDKLRSRGIFIMCYFSAGSFENWRPDAPAFPQDVLGKDMEGWPGEKWLDIRQVDRLAAIMDLRLDLAVQKGCHGVDPDNVNGYTNDTGFSLTYEDQLKFNIHLANAAHVRGLSIGLKNDLEQIPDLLPYFDWALNEECFSYNECKALESFILAGKPVFVMEYELTPEEFCPLALEKQFNAIQKNRDLDEYVTHCKG